MDSLYFISKRMKTIKTLLGNRIFWLIIWIILLVIRFLTLYTFSDEFTWIFSLFIEASFVTSCWLFSKKYWIKWLLYITIFCASLFIYLYLIGEVIAIESIVLAILAIISSHLIIPAWWIILLKLVQKKFLSK